MKPATGVIGKSPLRNDETMWSMIILTLVFLAVPFSTSAATVDPTKGQFVNATPWGIEIFVDQDPQSLHSATGIILNSQEVRQFNLDLGPHRIIVLAYGPTWSGSRVAARYDRTIQVDPRGSGWTLHFSEADFLSAEEMAARRLESGLRALREGHYGAARANLTAAAWHGNAQAQAYLGWIYWTGKGLPRDYAEAAEWFRKAAEQGNAMAQGNLGQMYVRGEGVPQDYAKAAEWFRKAAMQGNAVAQVHLGSLYWTGKGVAQDYAKAARWLRWSALQGNVAAQVQLGSLKWIGYKGVPQDRVEATRWFRKAAKQGDTHGQVILGRIYDKGEGVPQDYVQAYRWYTLALRRGATGLVEDRDELAKKMTRAQIAEAERLAAQRQ